MPIIGSIEIYGDMDIKWFISIFNISFYHYHFHPLREHVDNSWAITAESSPLHIAGSRTRTRNLLVSERNPLTTELRALISFCRRKRSHFSQCHTILDKKEICFQYVLPQIKLLLNLIEQRGRR